MVQIAPLNLIHIRRVPRMIKLHFFCKYPKCAHHVLLQLAWNACVTCVTLIPAETRVELIMTLRPCTWYSTSSDLTATCNLNTTWIVTYTLEHYICRNELDRLSPRYSTITLCLSVYNTALSLEKTLISLSDEHIARWLNRALAITPLLYNV